MNLEDELTVRFLEYINNKRPSVDDSLDYFAGLLKEEALEVRGKGAQPLLSQFKELSLQGVDALNVTEFKYDFPDTEIQVPYRGRIFKINTSSNNFFLKAYQRKEERAVVDKLYDNPLIVAVGRFGWLFVEREMTSSNIFEDLDKNPFDCGLVYGRILSELHKNEVVYNDVLLSHSYLEGDEPRLIDLGVSSLSDPFENDYLQIFGHVIERMGSEEDQKKFLDGFSQTYHNMNRFNKFIEKKDPTKWDLLLGNERIIQDKLIPEKFIREKLIPDYFNITPESVFKDLLQLYSKKL